MAIGKVQMTFTSDTGLPRDSVVNTFHVQSADLAGNGEGIKACFVNFYESATASGSSINAYRSVELTGAGSFKLYNLADPTPRVPVFEDTFTGMGTSGDALPSEVAVVMSYRAPYASGTPNAQRRNRIYLGPLSKSAAGASVPPRPVPLLRTTIGEAAIRLQGQLGANATTWVVYSKVSGLAIPVTDGWVDDAFDTQRRRGESATTRTEWTIA